MKRMTIGVAVLMLGLLPIGASAASPSANSPTRAPAPAAAAARTGYAFTASGYATFVDGGVVPAQSGKTALAILACTNQAPIRQSNRVDEANLTPLPVQVTGLVTTAQSLAVPGGFASLSENKTDVVVGIPPAASLNIIGLRTKARAQFASGVWSADVDFSFASATLTVAGVPTPISLPMLQDGINVPGVGEVQLGWERTNTTNKSAAARGRGLRIVVNLPGEEPTRVIVGEVFANLDRRPFGGIFGGGANVAKTEALNGAVLSGPLANQPHFCAGTNGEWREQNIAGVDIPGLSATGGRARVRTDDYAVENFTTSKSEASVADAELAGGAIQVEGLVVRSYTRLKADGTRKRDAAGTTIGRLIINGNVVALPDPGQSINVPGIATITFQRVRRLPTGLDVTGLRIELVEGDVAVVELGRAITKIDR